MNRKEFIKWLETSSGLSRRMSNYDDSWEELMNYADLIYDYLEVNENNVEFRYENMYWGGSSIETNTYSFDDFKRLYETYSLK